MTDLMADDTFEPDYGDNDELDNKTKIDVADNVESDDGEIKSGKLRFLAFKLTTIVVTLYYCGDFVQLNFENNIGFFLSPKLINMYFQQNIPVHNDAWFRRRGWRTLGE